MSIPADSLSDWGHSLIAELAYGGDGSVALLAAGAAGTQKQLVCQRAMDLLTLPPCPAGESNSTDASGTNLTCTAMGGVDVATLQQKVIAACQAQGVTVTAGMSNTTKMLLLGGGALVLLLIASKAMK